LDTERILNRAVEIQQIPGPTFEESERSAYLEHEFHAVGLVDITVDNLGNVFGRTPGSGMPRIIVSAHIDSVFPSDTQLDIRREDTLLIGPGIGDNAIALALMLEFVDEKIKHLPPDSGLCFVGNVREEGLGNLEGMQRVVERFKNDARAYIVLEGMGLGHIYHRGLQVHRYRISVETPGGHAWIHAGQDSAIHTLIDIGSEIIRLPRSEKVLSSLNIGSIRGGTSINTIASSANFDLDLRSESSTLLRELENGIESILERFQTETISVGIEDIGHRPGGEIPEDHDLVKLACEALDASEVSNCRLGIASTDANVPLSQGYPAICLGLTLGGNAHSTREFIDIESIPNGYRMLTHLLLNAVELSNRW
jgi:tripeptide aminopeptidase